MRCKKHPADFSSGVGVCASCLRERLLAIMEAQAQKQSQSHLHRDCRKSDAQQQLQQPPPLPFPRSVSPYISRQNTAAGAATAWHLNHRSLYCTPQLGPAAVVVKNGKRSGGRFSSMFLGIFRSKSDKHLDSGSGMGPDPDPGVLVESYSAPSSWFSNMLPGRRKKQIRSFSVDESSIRAQHIHRRNRDRGMSPARHSDEDDDEHCPGGSSGYSSESSQGWKQTPRRTPATTRRTGAKGAAHGKNISGLAFCLSPLVRASPNRHWSQKVLPPEAAEPRVPAKPYLASAASFCKNRSRKLADFGRYNNSRH